jgi:AhpD family alkylhydroperoxidase
MARAHLMVQREPVAARTSRIDSSVRRAAEEESHMSRLEYWKVDPEGVRAATQLSTYLARSGMDRALLEMVDLRVSQMNGCSYCVDLHARDAVARGLDQRLVNDVAAWREVPFFDERRLRIILDWTVALFFRPDITKVDLAAEQEQTRRNRAAGATRPRIEGVKPSVVVHGTGARMATATTEV